MPFLLVFLALVTPRIVVLLLWFLTQWFTGLFQSLLWPVLGLVFLPTTLLWYSAVQQWYGGQWSLWPVVGLVVALVIDSSPAGRLRRRQ